MSHHTDDFFFFITQQSVTSLISKSSLKLCEADIRGGYQAYNTWIISAFGHIYPCPKGMVEFSNISAHMEDHFLEVVGALVLLIAHYILFVFVFFGHDFIKISAFTEMCFFFSR